MTSPAVDLQALANWLKEQTWSEFAQSLASFYAKNGYFSPKQEAAARAMHAKVSARQAPAAAKPVEVASGHYALLVDGIVKFYRVNNVTEGRWAGYTFVDAQASDEYHKVGREGSARVLAAIAADPQAAMKLYGISLGRCGHCNRTLTDETSRAAGIGPICAGRMGW